jgi:hypothetical protein
MKSMNMSTRTLKRFHTERMAPTNSLGIQEPPRITPQTQGTFILCNNRLVVQYTETVLMIYPIVHIRHLSKKTHKETQTQIANEKIEEFLIVWERKADEEPSLKTSTERTQWITVCIQVCVCALRLLYPILFILFYCLLVLSCLILCVPTPRCMPKTRFNTRDFIYMFPFVQLEFGFCDYCCYCSRRIRESCSFFSLAECDCK